VGKEKKRKRKVGEERKRNLLCFTSQYRHHFNRKIKEEREKRKRKNSTGENEKEKEKKKEKEVSAVIAPVLFSVHLQLHPYGGEEGKEFKREKRGRKKK